MTKAKTTPEAINDEALDAVAGGALLLPAVQAAREAASRSRHLTGAGRGDRGRG